MSMALDPTLTIAADIDRVPAALATRARDIPAATLHEAAGRIGDLPPALKPFAATPRMAGAAVTVTCPNGDNLWIHRAMAIARPGDVLVVQAGEGPEFGYWGEVMSTAAKARGLAGLVIDGCVRDVPLLREIGFPVFARGLCIRGTIKDPAVRGWVNAPVLIGQVTIHPGDLVVGDEDGVVAIPRDMAEQVLEAAVARELKEAAMCETLAAGRITTLELLGLS